MGFVLPLGTFALSPEIAPEHQMAHYRHMFMYGTASTVITFVWVVICYSFVCRRGCEPSEAFAWKVAGAVVSPLILIGCNVLLPWLTADELPDVYTGYLIGRLCFLMALSMLFCLGITGDVAEKQYDEGLVQLRMAWAAFALLFASDPILTRYLYAIPQQGEMLHGQLQELANRLQSVQEHIQGLHEHVQAIQIKLKEGARVVKAGIF